MATLTAEDRRLLGENIERFAARHGHDLDQRRAALSGADGTGRAVWNELAGLGLLGLGLPEDVGGIGGSIVDLGVVMGAIGRHLLTEPYLSTAVVAAPLAADLDPHASHVDFRAVIAGERILALAHFEPELGFARAPIATRAVKAGSRYSLHGAKSFILDAALADTLLVSAQAPDGELGLFLVEKDAVAGSLRSFRSVDRRWVGELALDEVPSNRIGGAASTAIEAALDRGIIAVGFEAVASMKLLIDDTTAYVKERRAFGKTLSQFQVLQHRLVDMFILAEEAQAIVDAAADASAVAAPERAVLVAAAKTHLCRAARFVAENAVQLHGGIAMTDQLRVSHHFKRLMMIEALFGDGECHLERYIELSAPLRGERH
ncbi:MAG: acyl-CoA dehydrogenase [Gammaproteobacteria bacterium]|jgi:alkylation response protein AidB-like acyl-CoA dehydrogenase|nr:acyl-CoA dehydrogenase [Gammaproteobacteria bacterium]